MNTDRDDPLSALPAAVAAAVSSYGMAMRLLGSAIGGDPKLPDDLLSVHTDRVRRAERRVMEAIIAMTKERT